MRIDFIFSYWIFGWYVLYMLQVVPYNPKFALWCGLMENGMIVLLMLYYRTRMRWVGLFLFMMGLLKIGPLLTLKKTVVWQDVWTTLLLFCVYLGWIMGNHQDPKLFVKRTTDLILHNKNTLPGMQWIDRMLKKD